MANSKPKTARAIAIAVLNQTDPEQSYAAPVLNKLLPQTTEKQRATDLVFGTIRNRAAIDILIAKLADCPTSRIAPKLLNIIRIGAYELFYNPQTPDYAIINEAVDNAKAVAGRKQTSFVNAVLRQTSRKITSRQAPLSDAEPQKTLPQTLSTGCQFNTRFLPDPKQSPAEYYSSAFSLPKWLVADWLAEFGFDQTRNICFASNRRPGIYLRANVLKTTTKQLAEKFHQADISCEIVGQAMIKIKSPHAVTQLPGFDEGLFTVQDITAAQAINTLKPQPNQIILDLCAAPGSKTTHLAEFTADKTTIIATDISNQRLEKVKENINRLGINSVTIVPYENLEQVTAELGPFDCVLVDVPCSNTGVLAKRPEVRYRIKPNTLPKITKIQNQLLDTAAKMLKTKGKICYSTCSIQPAENHRLIAGFLQKNPDFQLTYELLTLPSSDRFDHDGGYVAIIENK